ncbi:MAG: hypothetical protein QM764_05520 [Chitinophagaceae bacterium]
MNKLNFNNPRIRFLAPDTVLVNKIVLYFAFATFLLGLKFWLIYNYGNPTPFWDQWDGEAANLYKPYVSGTLRWSDMIAPHNEHRIFTTRVLSLLLLKINGIWNPEFQMVVNAALHIFLIIICISFLTKTIGVRYLRALLVFSVVLFGIPYAWEKTLAGFQSQFYFVVFFSILSLWFISTKEPLSIGWWCGAVCSVFAFFSLSSGVFTFGAATFISFIIFITNVRRTPRQLNAIIILGICFLISLKFTPSVPGHAVFKASTFSQFYVALTGVLGWPVSAGFFATLITIFPSFIFMVMVLRKPPQANDSKWFLVALILWSFGQALSLAYGRAAIYLASRYLDLSAINLLVNFSVLILIIQKWQINHPIRGAAIVAGWALIILVSLCRKGLKILPDDLEAKRRTSKIQESNTHNYLSTGDTSFIKSKPQLDIPYPNSDRFSMILSWPEIRQILPPSISPGINPATIQQQPSEVFVKNGFYPTTTGYSDSSWGSYNSRGDTATGEIYLNFETFTTGGHIKIPIAGYPLNNGIKLEIRQNKVSSPISISENPKETWLMVDAKIQKGPFSIYASDSSKTTWLAIGKPIIQGRVDNFIIRILSHYYLFLLTGLIVFVCLVIASCLPLKTVAALTKHQPNPN